MFQDIANYFEARFTAEPAIQEITFSSTHRLCITLNKAGVSLWLYSDVGVCRKLMNPWLDGPHREYRPRRGGGASRTWIFTRPERLQ